MDAAKEILKTTASRIDELNHTITSAYREINIQTERGGRYARPREILKNIASIQEMEYAVFELSFVKSKAIELLKNDDWAETLEEAEKRGD